MAWTNYSDAISFCETVRIDPNKQFVSLVIKSGKSLGILGHFAEAVEKFIIALDKANKLDKKPTSCKARVYCELARTYSYWKPDCQEAAGYAQTAMEMKELLDQHSLNILQDIIQKAEGNIL